MMNGCCWSMPNVVNKYLTCLKEVGSFLAYHLRSLITIRTANWQSHIWASGFCIVRMHRRINNTLWLVICFLEKILLFLLSRLQYWRLVINLLDWLCLTKNKGIWFFRRPQTVINTQTDKFPTSSSHPQQRKAIMAKKKQPISGFDYVMPKPDAETIRQHIIHYNSYKYTYVFQK